MLNYTVDPALLEPAVPSGVELDQFQGKTYLSLVGFEFQRTRVRGLAVPFHENFEEVNLRFYVRRGEKRGVVFLRELVPRRAVAAVARIAFNENYRATPMSHRIETDSDGEAVAAEYSWGFAENRCSMRIETEGEGFLPPDGSLSQFITEHYWGYAAGRGGGCLEYEVEHPRWLARKAKTATFSGNADRFYGPRFAEVLASEPASAFLANGSPVTVFQAARLV